MMKRMIGLSLCATLLFLLCAACAAAPQHRTNEFKPMMDMAFDSDADPAEPPPPAASREGYADSLSMMNGSTSDIQYDLQADPNRKLIRTGELRIESLSFEESLAALERLVGSLGGYYDGSNVTGVSKNSSGYENLRAAVYTVRIPAGQFDVFLSRGGELGNVLSCSTSTTDVTDQYFDTEAHLDMLRMELRMLQEEFNKDGPMADRITLLDKMTNVQYEIERLTGTLRKYDGLIEYATVTVTIQEVVEIADPEPLKAEPKTLGQRIVRQISDSWDSFTSGGANFIVWFTGALPFLLFWGLLIFLGVFFGRKIYKNYQNKHPAPARVYPPYPTQSADPSENPQSPNGAE